MASAASSYLKNAMMENATTQSNKTHQRSTSALNPSQSFSAWSISDFPQASEVEHPEKLIDQQIVFKAAMSSNYSKIIELAILKEDITKIDANNAILKQLGPNLRRFDVSFNHIKQIENLDVLQNLRELNLSHNNIKNIENLQKLPQLRVLTLDYNKIDKIKNIKNLRKLEKLSLVGNCLKDVMQESTENMLELKELCLQKNNIKFIEAIHNFPNLEDLWLSGNPLQMIFPEAMQQLKNLRFLAVDNVKLRYPEQDLVFLKKVEHTLTRLSMNNAFPKLNMESTEVFSLFKFENLDDLSLRSNGILTLKKIENFAPNITVLDLAYNKIFSVECIEILHKLPNLAEVNFNENPICVHKHLKEMILDVVPDIEVINRETLKEAGHKYKEELQKLRKNINNLGQKVENIGDNENYEPPEGDDIDSKARGLEKIYDQVKKDEGKSEQLFNDIEKNFGLRVKVLNDYADANDEARLDPLKDVEIFQEVIKHTYGEIRKVQRDTIGDCRLREHDTFYRISASQGGPRADGNAYSKIDTEIAKIKDKVSQAQEAKHLLSNMFGFDDKKPLTFRDFYKARAESDSEEGFEDEAQEPEGPWSTNKKPAITVKKNMYQNQLKKVIEASTPGLPPRRQDSATRRSRDFIINKKGSTPSMSSSQTNFNSVKESEKAMKETRKQLGTFGAKPHLLSKQNEVIQRMMERGNNTITSGDPLMMTGEQKFNTPKVPKKTNSARRSDSQARVIEKEMVLPKGNTILQQKNSMGFIAPEKTMRSTSTVGPKKESAKRSKSESSISSTELDLDGIPDDESNSSAKKGIDPIKRAMLFKPLQTKNGKKQTELKYFQMAGEKAPEFKTNFLADFLEHTESKIEFESQQAKMREKLRQYQKSKPKPPVERVAQLPPSFKSKALRPKPEMEDGNTSTYIEPPLPQMTPEEEARLTTEQITDGVNKAKEAMNAPPLDLIAFEQQLKQKHEEYQKAGITPVIRNKIRVPIQKVAKKN